MIRYYDLSVPFRSLLILALFLELCAGGYLLYMGLRRKRTVHLPGILTALLCSAVPMALYTAEARARLRSLSVPAASDWLCRQPIAVLSVLIFLILAYSVLLLKEERRYRENAITRFSIKEGVDKLASGLCFSQKDGRVVLVNDCMNRLCFSIVGRDLQNAALFWEILCNGSVRADVQRLSGGDTPWFRLSDGTVWSFACEELEGICQLTAANITQLQKVTDELEDKNRALAELNRRLRIHSENVDELTRSRERLEIKNRIHSELGQALLSTRCYLMDDADRTPPLKLWQRNIAMLRMEADLKKDEQPLEQLFRIASSIGMAITVKGELPVNEAVQKVFAQAGAEALTNAVGHARAKTLFVELWETETACTICFRNDGDRPKGPVVEGGGLGSLRQRIEGEGGVMEVAAEPDFSLTVVLPKEKQPRI